MKRAILMSRVSSDEQAKGYSLDVQEQRLVEYCQKNKIEIIQRYREDHSAKSFERPEYKKMEALAKKSKGMVDYLLFLTWDRFSRNASEAYQKIDLFRSLGIEVQAIEQAIDFSIPENKIMLAVYLAYPQVENERRAIKIISGVRAAQKDGRWLGKAPYGYKNGRDHTGKPIITPNEKAEVIKTIFSAVAKGESQSEVREKLKNRGILLSKSRFSELLRSRTYIGEIFVKSDDAPPGYYVKGRHQAIVSEEAFYSVQKILDGKALVRRGNEKYNTASEELFLRGHITCPCCGSHVTGSASRSRNHQRHFYYHCNHCKKYRMSAASTHKLLEEILSEFSFSIPAQKVYEHMVKTQISSSYKERKRSKETLQMEVEELKKKLDNLDNKYAENVIGNEAYFRLYDKFKQQLQVVNLELEDYTTENTEYRNYLKSGIHLLKNLPGFYRESDIDKRKKIIGSIFPENLQILKSKSRTTRVNEVIRLILATSKGSTEKKTEQPFKNLELSGEVEVTGIEPVSKHDFQKLSTCLFPN